jgi:hypothetical protein
LKNFSKNPNIACIKIGTDENCTPDNCIIKKIAVDNNSMLCGIRTETRRKRAKYSSILLDLYERLNKGSNI